MARKSENMNKHGPRNLTRTGAKRPKIPRSWTGRVQMRALAKVLDRLDETVRAFEIRQEISEKRRNWRGYPRLKAIRERRQAEAAHIENCRRNAQKLKRDVDGRFVPKQRRRKAPSIKQQHRHTSSDQGIIEKLALADQEPGHDPARNIGPVVASDDAQKQPHRET